MSIIVAVAAPPCSPPPQHSPAAAAARRPHPHQQQQGGGSRGSSGHVVRRHKLGSEQEGARCLQLQSAAPMLGHLASSHTVLSFSSRSWFLICARAASSGAQWSLASLPGQHSPSAAGAAAAAPTHLGVLAQSLAARQRALDPRRLGPAMPKLRRGHSVRATTHVYLVRARIGDGGIAAPVAAHEVR
eukprot:scaffold4085_cov264-Prasinococcus_capsulatus_cf.AAC.4